MSALEQQARKILASLVAKPGLMYEILSIVADEYDVASPWFELESSKGIYFERRDPEQESIAMVAPIPGNDDKWQWQVKNGASGRTDDHTTAFVAADQELRRLGWLLP